MRRVRRLRCTDAGMTLIEVSIAVIVVSIVFAALAGLLATTIKAQRLNELRVQGTQLAQERLENLRATPWPMLGLYNDEAGYVASVDGESSVDLGATPTPREVRVPSPVVTETLQNVEYTIVTNITWAPGSSETNERAKNLSVTVSWEQYGSTRTVRADAQRASTSSEVPVAGSGALVFAVSLSASPSVVNLDSAGNTETSLLLEATTTTAVSQARVSYSTRNGVVETHDMTTTGDPTSWRFTLPAGEGPFDPGTTRFTVQATDLFTGQATGETTVELTSASSTLAITNVVINPSGVNLNSGGRNAEGFTVEATFNAPVTSAVASIPAASGASPVTMTLSADRLSAVASVAQSAFAFEPGDRQVTVTASADTTVTAPRMMSFIAAGTPDVEIVDLESSPSTFCAAGDGQNPLKAPVTVTAQINGLRATDKVEMRFNAKNQPIFPAASSDGATWRVDLDPGDLQFKHSDLSNSINVTVTAIRMPDGTPTTATESFTLTIGGC